MKSKFARYLEMADMEKDIAELPENWVLAEWHPCEESFSQEDNRGLQERVRWRATVFYARFVEVNVPVKPMGMKAR